ncbi:autotransporter domain-containing protein [Sphingomonas sp. LY54]|uniref:autotransporter outer membrane beta-barrel domain-containing protein n=1 Tax=Sphingomonas sp. LY54 TaxID=3095343 RepID=UPI002D7A24E4|nr:autotransporter domain-containing protein [Sphingomonas sp. LY54]WRP29664.1 autotransporter domain-containing protein [Sphingomonas sp. LY54]
MRNLLAATCLTPVILFVATPAAAETVVGTATTAALRTATAANGARDDIRIASAGSVKPTSGTAVTLDSANSVKNEGTIQITDANDATGIIAAAGGSGTITNSGTITIDETYAATDADKDGDLDGPFAQGARRFGIRVATGGDFTGSIVNSGTITIEGNQSAGIAVSDRLVGGLTSSGKIAVLGDQSVGIALNDVTGNVTLTGSIDARGANAVGMAADGNIGGAFVVQGAVSASGYRVNAAGTDVTKLDADDLLQGGPAVRIAGDVAGGILFDAPPRNLSETDKDEDKDGIEDDKEGTAAISSFGAAPAVQIGAAGRDLAIGAVAGTANGGHGIVVNGSIAADGVYKSINATGLAIGGLGGAVTVAGGVTVNGAVAANSNQGNAAAIRIGDRASLGEIKVTGQVGARGGEAEGSTVHGVLIEQGASVGTIRNAGRITAQVAGAKGVAGAIVDRAGTVTLVENSGIITATGVGAGNSVAVDLRANSAGATIRQPVAAANVAAPAITGDVWFGSGDDLFDLADGTMTGTTRFGTGANRLSLSGDAAYAGEVVFDAGADTMALADTARHNGNVDFGGGADSLTLAGTSVFSGALANSAGLAVNVAGGTLDLTNKGAVALSSLTLAQGSSLTVSIDSAAGTNTLYDVAGAASFAQDTKVNLRLSSVAGSEGNYVIVRAGTLTGGGNLTTAGASLPFLYASTLAANPTAGEVSLQIRRKTATELGLTRSQASAYGAVFEQLDADAQMASSFLAVQDGESFRSQLQQLLPEHAGGTFETVTQASRATARFLADPRSPLVDMGGWGFFLQQVAWGSSKSVGDTASYDVTGWGASAGAELTGSPIGNFGVSLAYLLGKDADGGNDNEVSTNQYEIAAYWRNNWDALQAFARVSGAYIQFDGARSFRGTTGTQNVTRETRGDWNGTLFSAAAGVSYEAQFGRLSLRPAVSVDYYRLKEDGYAETGGGAAFDLIVDDRTGDEAAANASVTLGYDLMGGKKGENFFRFEVEGGRRELIGGSLGATTARFEDGDAFTLASVERTSGWLGRLRVLGGNGDFLVGAELSGEEQQSRAAIAGRVTLQFGF